MADLYGTAPWLPRGGLLSPYQQFALPNFFQPPQAPRAAPAPPPAFGAPLEPPPKEGGNADPNGPVGGQGTPVGGNIGGLGIGGIGLGNSSVAGTVGGLLGGVVAGPAGGLIGSTIGNSISSANTTANQGLAPSVGNLGVGLANTGTIGAINGLLGAIGIGTNDNPAIGNTQANADVDNALNDISKNGIDATVSATNAAADADPDSAGATGGSGNPSGGDPNGGQGGEPGDGGTGGYAKGGVITKAKIKGKAPDKVDDGWAQVKAGEGVVNQGAMSLLGPKGLGLLNALGTQHAQRRAGGLLGG